MIDVISEEVVITMQEAINNLIEDDLDIGADMNAYISDILRDGFKGYNNYTLEELTEEYNQRINPDDVQVTIKP